MIYFLRGSPIPKGAWSLVYISLLLLYFPGVERLFYGLTFLLFLMIGYRLISRFQTEGRHRLDRFMPSILSGLLLLVLYGFSFRWWPAPGLLSDFLLSTGRIYILGTLLEGFLIGTLGSVVLSALKRRFFRS